MVADLLKPENMNLKSSQVRRTQNAKFYTLINLIGMILFAACCSAALLLTNAILDGNQRNSTIMRQLLSTGYDFTTFNSFNDTVRWLSQLNEL